MLFLIFYFARFCGLPPPNPLADLASIEILPVGPHDKRLAFWPVGFV